MNPKYSAIRGAIPVCLSSLLLLLSIVWNCSCAWSLPPSGPAAAARVAAELARAIYFSHDYPGALQMLAGNVGDAQHPAATADQLAKLDQQFEKHYGPLLTLEMESYHMGPGDDIDIVATATHEGGRSSYHQFTLKGHGQIYQVFGFHFQDQPYPDATPLSETLAITEDRTTPGPPVSPRPMWSDQDHVITMWRGPAPELNTSVLVVYLSPEGSLTDVDAVNRQAHAFWDRWRPKAEEGPWGIAIVRVTNATKEQLESGAMPQGFNGAASYVFVRDANGHLLKDPGPELLSKVILWEGKLHGVYMVRVPPGLMLALLGVALATLAIIFRWLRARRRQLAAQP